MTIDKWKIAFVGLALISFITGSVNGYNAFEQQEMERFAEQTLRSQSDVWSSFVNVQCEKYHNQYLNGYHCYASQVKVDNGEVAQDKTKAAVVECHGNPFQDIQCQLKSTWNLDERQS